MMFRVFNKYYLKEAWKMRRMRMRMGYLAEKK